MILHIKKHHCLQELFLENNVVYKTAAQNKVSVTVNAKNRIYVKVHTSVFISYYWLTDT